MKQFTYLTLAVGWLFSLSLQAQSGTTPVNGQNPMASAPANQPQTQSVVIGNPPTPMDGNAALGPTYSYSDCGLNYTTASLKLGQRISPAGVPQPATFTISGIPATALIVKAFIWCDASGTGVPITLNVTNPFFTNFTYSMTLIGSDQDKCWGYAGTHSYRADITSCAWGNGNYTISGFPTGTPDDVDGATMMVIWSDPTANFQGDIVIWDGALVINGGNTSTTINNFTACSLQVNNARAFMCVADLQGLGSQLTLNGVFPITVVEDWWNYIDVATTVTPNQNTSVFGNSSGGDCYNMCMIGLYFQSTCQTCCANPFTLNMSSTPSSCSASNGTATAAPNGGTGPFTYNWNTSPAQTGQTASNLPPGQYIVTVSDSLGCSATDTVVVNGIGALNITPSQQNVGCYGAATGWALALPNGGNAPYTYVWTTPNGNDSIATNLAAGTYTVTVSDNFGCDTTHVFTITEPPLVPLVANLTGTSAICIGAQVSLNATASGGSGGPYSYTWLNATGTGNTATDSPTATTTYSVVINDTCGTPADTATWTVTVNPLPVITVSGTPLQGCPTLCSDLTATSVPAAVTVAWTFGDNSTGTGSPVNHCYPQTGTYDITVGVQDVNGCINSLSLPAYITVHPVPVAGIGILSPQPATLEESTISFDDLSQGSDSCVWYMGNSNVIVLDNCGDLSYTYDAIGIYTVSQVVYNQYGCMDSTSTTVEIIPQSILYVPNTFTPNGDGKNDFFTAYGQYIENFNMLIYDRWGNLIYTTNDMTKGWDGRANGGKDIAQIDTYVYVITYNETYGVARKYKKMGHVNLIR
jgi:gliding motility-associated-like protein